MSEERAILYVGGTVPARSETFVYREIFGLRDRGVDVAVASVHPPESGLGDSRVDALAQEVIGVYGLGAGRLMADTLKELGQRPMRVSERFG